MESLIDGRDRIEDRISGLEDKVEKSNHLSKKVIHFKQLIIRYVETLEYHKKINLKVWVQKEGNSRSKA